MLSVHPLIFRPLTLYKVFRDKILSMADVDPGGEEAAVTFDGVVILTPR